MIFLLLALETELFSFKDTLLLKIELGSAYTYFTYPGDFGEAPDVTFTYKNFSTLPLPEPSVFIEEKMPVIGYKNTLYLFFKKEKDTKDEISIRLTYCENSLCKIYNHKESFDLNTLKNFSESLLDLIPKDFNEVMNVNTKNSFINFSDYSIIPLKKMKLTSKGITLSDFSSFKAYYNNTIVTVAPIQNQSLSLYYLLIAFLGGLILNFMPCVLPVLTFKLHPSQSRKNKIFYVLGSMTTFLVLASLSIFLTSFSWGFQMQSPLFLFFFATILFLLLVDIYSEKNFFQNFSSTSYFFDKFSVLKDFFEGVLSTILSTPCTGPFLTTALSLSLQLPPLEIFLLFFSIGIGFNFPVLLFIIFPNSLFLPKSGPWMDYLKDFLNAILIFVFLWIVYLNTLQGQSLWFFIYFGFIFLLLISKNKTLKIMFLLLSCLSFYKIFYSKKDNIQVYLNPYQVNNNVVMNFTAKWCLTCQLYKETLLKSSFFLNFLQKNNLTLVEISLDENNPEAQKFLKEHGVEGIPAYFLKKNETNVYIGSWFSEKTLLEL